MELNDHRIGSRELLRKNFNPFGKIWENVESGSYQECIRAISEREAFTEEMEELTEEILGLTEKLLHGSDETGAENRPLEDVYQNFRKNNAGQMEQLEKIAENEKQRLVLYLCVLMHVHAGCGSMEPETEEYIRTRLEEMKLPEDIANPSEEPDIYRQSCGVIGGGLYLLDSEGRIVRADDKRALQMAEGLRGLRSFSYTDRLGLITVDRYGKVRVRGGREEVRIPSGIKMAAVSAHLSNYMMLSEEGDAYTISVWTCPSGRTCAISMWDKTALPALKEEAEAW